MVSKQTKLRWIQQRPRLCSNKLIRTREPIVADSGCSEQTPHALCKKPLFSASVAEGKKTSQKILKLLFTAQKPTFYFKDHTVMNHNIWNLVLLFFLSKNF